MTRLLLAVWAMGALPVVAGLFPDDLPNTVMTAHSLVPNAAPVVHTIDYDADTDWFSFVALPQVTYTVTVQSVTLFDSHVEFRAFPGGNPLSLTNSAFTRPTSNSLSQWVWTHPGSPQLIRFGVEGLFNFTTGTFSVAVSGNLTDTNGDDIPDAWYLHYFTNLTHHASDDPDGDGITNEQEFWAGTHPNLASSGLRITDLNQQQGQGRVYWPAAALGVYEVSATTNLVLSSGWSVLGLLTNEGLTPVTVDMLDGAETNSVHRAYRIRQLLDLP